MPAPWSAPDVAEHAPKAPLRRFASGYCEGGPGYLGVRTLCEHSAAPPDGLVVISEPGRALNARDVEHVSGRTVVAVIEHTTGVARTFDAGLFIHRVERLREFTQLRTWLAQTVSEEAPCTPRS